MRTILNVLWILILLGFTVQFVLLVARWRFRRLTEKACFATYRLLSHEFDVEELAVMHVVVQHNQDIERLTNSWFMRINARLSRVIKKYPLTERVIAGFLFSELEKRGVLDAVVTFLTQEEVRHEWSRYERLPEEVRERFESFITTPEQDRGSTTNDNIRRYCSWYVSRMGTDVIVDRNLYTVLSGTTQFIPVFLVRSISRDEILNFLNQENSLEP